jgi:hypothetical protein
MPKVPYLYEVNSKLVTENGSLIPICSLSNRFLLPSLTVHQNDRLNCLNMQMAKNKWPELVLEQLFMSH